MPKKKHRAAKPLTEKQRASDDALREVLRTADLKAFDKILTKAIRPPASKA